MSRTAFPSPGRIRNRLLLKDFRGFRPFNTKMRMLAFSFLPAVLLAACASAPRHPEAAFERHDWRLAVEQAREWQESHPGDSTATVIRGRSELALGDTALALQTLQPFALTTADPELRGEILGAAIAMGELDLASAVIARETTFSGDNAALNHQFAIVEQRVREARRYEALGDSAVLDEDWVQASRAFRNASRLYAGNHVYQAKLHFTEAEVLVGAGGSERAESALKHIDEALRLWPDSPMPWWVKGDVFLQLGETDSAREAFQESLRLGIAEPFRSVARAYTNGGR